MSIIVRLATEANVSRLFDVETVALMLRKTLFQRRTDERGLIMPAS